MTTWTAVPVADDAYVIEDYVLSQYVSFDWEPTATTSTTWT